MADGIQPHEFLLEIGASFARCSDGKDQRRKQDHSTAPQFSDRVIHPVIAHQDFSTYELSRDEVLIISLAWYLYIVERKLQFDPVTLLRTIWRDKEYWIKHLDTVIALLEKQVFYTTKKQVLDYDSSHTANIPHVRFHKYNLLEKDMGFHRTFIRNLLHETEDISLKSDRPYRNNREYVDDWFCYVDYLYDYSFFNLNHRKVFAKMGETATNDYLKAMEWKDRIEKRSRKTKEMFPLMDIIDEYNLEHKESTILMFLVKEELGGNEVRSEELIKLISRDQHDVYANRKYISDESKLVKHGLIELSENLFFRSKGSEIRVSPDIMRQIIMKSPVTDDERLKQILEGNEIFTIMESKHSLSDLILPRGLKETIHFSINQYQENVDRTLTTWGLFNGNVSVSGQSDRKFEPGLLMLFYGHPGTGKTFAAGTIAHALGKKLLVTDMSRIQSKWIGDSEKNVRRLFSVFERIVRRVENPPVLLLNEADQFLSRRVGTINTSVDVMFNTMQNLFLEAFERLRGVMIATTNLIDNMDTAFSRRFHLKLEFPVPSEKERQRLWKLHLPSTIPGAAKVDIIHLAKTYTLTGGQIAVVVNNAATKAAARKGNARKLMLDDLLKYCDLEIASTFDRNIEKIGFKM